MTGRSRPRRNGCRPTATGSPERPTQNTKTINKHKIKSPVFFLFLMTGIFLTITGYFPNTHLFALWWCKLKRDYFIFFDPTPRLAHILGGPLFFGTVIFLVLSPLLWAYPPPMFTTPTSQGDRNFFPPTSGSAQWWSRRFCWYFFPVVLSYYLKSPLRPVGCLTNSLRGFFVGLNHHRFP